MKTHGEKCKDNWMKLANYLSDEKMEGKTEFVLSFQNGCDFIIHPEGKNGKTLDLSICIPLSNEGWQYASLPAKVSEPRNEQLTCPHTYHTKSGYCKYCGLYNADKNIL
jgi:hypothetical protein